MAFTSNSLFCADAELAVNTIFFPLITVELEHHQLSRLKELLVLY